MSRHSGRSKVDGMPRKDTGPDFIEALARGLDVIKAFGPRQRVMSLTEVATATGLARPTARRILLTLEELGYVRAAEGGFALTPGCWSWGSPTSIRWACGRSPAPTWSSCRP